MSPVASCRLVRLVSFRAVLSGLRAVLCRPVTPRSAWFVCKWFAPKQGNARANRPVTRTGLGSTLFPHAAFSPTCRCPRRYETLPGNTLAEIEEGCDVAAGAH